MGHKIKILSGGTGRELCRIGAPFRQPEWSALALYEAPEKVREVHKSFLEAGAQTLTINSYAVVPFHLGWERFRKDGLFLADLAGKLARKAVDEAGGKVKILGCLPPLASYQPEHFNAKQAEEIYALLIEGQAPYADIWIGETLSSLKEAEGVARAVSHDKKPLWLSFTLADDVETLGKSSHKKSVLRSGESITEAVKKAIALGAENILFNCSHPEVMSQALREAKVYLRGSALSLGLGVCANAFHEASDEGNANEALNQIRSEMTPENYLEWAKEWTQEGATLLGGCCGIRPDHIRALSRYFRD
ncbi:homocysteine S-methyltransferase family protein [Acetobacteraceae bacterium]|nr:homocysteine S-methyltransferase family protein [Acetobacteraceae bacterium]